MPGITNYINIIKDIIDDTPFILSSNLEYENRGGVALYLRGNILFEDFSELFFKEFISYASGTQPDKLAYSYHYQNSQIELIFRYDNAEHHPEIPTFPHHKHLDKDEIISCQPASLNSVMLEIIDRLDRENSQK